MDHRQTVQIDHIGARGDGVAYVGGEALYIPFSVPGDELVLESAGSPRIAQIVNPGPDRQAAACSHFSICGGCALQHVAVPAYRDWKSFQIKQALGHRGFTNVDVEAPIVSPKNSRRRARLHALHRGRTGVAIGFHERGSNRIVNMAECPVLVPEIVELLGPLREFLGGLLSGGQSVDVNVTATVTGIDLGIESMQSLDLDLRMDLTEFAEKNDLARIWWGRDREIVLERRNVIVKPGGIPVALPPAAFLQATIEGEQELTRLVEEALPDAVRVADLFSGCGTFTFALAGRARVLAAEGDVAAIDALRKAANMATGLQEIITEQRDLFRRPLLATDLKSFDGVIFDPPRVGAKAQAEQIAISNVPVVVAVSCNPATFARDARTLVDGGYEMTKVTPVDQFLWSPHIELVAVFRKGRL